MKRIYLLLIIFSALFLFSFRFNAVHAQDENGFGGGDSFSDSGGDSSGTDSTDSGGGDSGTTDSGTDWSGGIVGIVDAGSCNGCGNGNEVTAIESGPDPNASYTGYISDPSQLNSDSPSGTYYNVNTGEAVDWGPRPEQNHCEFNCDTGYYGGGDDNPGNCCPPPPPVPPKPKVNIGSACTDTTGRYFGNDINISWDPTYPAVTWVDLGNSPGWNSWWINKRANPDGAWPAAAFTSAMGGFGSGNEYLSAGDTYYIRTWDGFTHSPNSDPFSLPACPLPPTVSVSLDVSSGQAAAGNFVGTYGISGQTANNGSNWINPMNVHITADTDGLVKNFYVAFYDKALPKLTGKGTFLNDAQGIVSNPQNGFLIKYQTDPAQHFVWAQGRWIPILINGGGIQVSNMYTVTGISGDSKSAIWQVTYTPNFISKSMYTAVYVEDTAGRTGFDADCVLQENVPCSTIKLQ